MTDRACVQLLLRVLPVAFGCEFGGDCTECSRSNRECLIEAVVMRTGSVVDHREGQEQPICANEGGQDIRALPLVGCCVPQGPDHLRHQCG